MATSLLPTGTGADTDADPIVSQVKRRGEAIVAMAEQGQAASGAWLGFFSYAAGGHYALHTDAGAVHGSERPWKAAMLFHVRA